MQEIASLKRSHVQWSNEASTPQLLSLCSSTWGLQQGSHQNKKAQHRY